MAASAMPNRDEGLEHLLGRFSSSVLEALSVRIASEEKQRLLLLDEVGSALAFVTELSEQVKARWREVCNTVANERTADAHVQRPALVRAAAHATQLSRDLEPLIDRVGKLTGESVVGVERFIVDPENRTTR